MFRCDGCVCLNMSLSLWLSEYVCSSVVFWCVDGTFITSRETVMAPQNGDIAKVPAFFLGYFLIYLTPLHLNYNFSFQTVLCSLFLTLLIFFYFCGLLGQKGRLSTQSAVWMLVFLW